jgi:hypothetical protein
LRISFTILTFLIFVSCSTTKNITTEQIIGKYQWSGVYGVGSTIEIQEDQTFEYNWQAGLMRGTTFGTWERDGNKIILTSEMQPSKNGIENFEIISTERKSSDSLSIKVISPYKETVPFAACILKKDTTTLAGVSTDFQGETKLPKLEADSLIISLLGYKTIRHKLDHSISTYVFKMEEGNDYYEYFTGETWTYKNGRLYHSSIKKEKYVKKDYYEKIE